MAWTTPVTRATGYVVLAADWNNEHVGDLQYLHGDSGLIDLNNTVRVFNGDLVNRSANGVIGYATGAGSSVTQITSRNTAVTINTPTGQIVTSAISIANGAAAVFTVNNSVAIITDTIVLSVNNNPVSGPLMMPFVTSTAAGAFQISYTNQSGASTTQQLGINFAIVRGVYA